MGQKEMLSEEKQVYKDQDTVARPLGPWTKNIHSLLKHFYDDGLPVPRIIRIDGDYEYAEYMQGDMIHPHKWNNDLLVEIGKLLRRLHDSAGSFEYPGCMEWKPWYLRELGTPSLCGHGDVAPWNVITRGGKITGLIDWEFAGPIDPLTELSRVCWLFPQLFDDDLGGLHGLPSPGERAKQVRLIIDAYGLDKGERRAFFERILETVICETAHEAIDARITFDSLGKLWGMAWRSRSLYWIWRNKDILRKAMD
jgi:hypothetical protein